MNPPNPTDFTPLPYNKWCNFATEITNKQITLTNKNEMKQTNFLKKTLLLVALVAGVSSAWATGTISIPQAAGNYIPIGTVPTSGSKTTATGITLTGCQVDGNAEAEDYTSYTIGSTNGATITAQFDLIAETGYYLFSFKSGAQDASVVTLTLSNSGSETIWSQDNIDIPDTNSWSLTIGHSFLIGNLEAGNYTMTLSVKSKTGTYAGNFGNFYFHTGPQLPWPLESNSQTLDLTSGSATQYATSEQPRYEENGTRLGYISDGKYVDKFYVYNSCANYYTLKVTCPNKQSGNTIKITVTDVKTGLDEVSETFNIDTSSDNQNFNMTNKVTKGFKKIRFDFPKANYQLKNVTFAIYKYVFDENDDYTPISASDVNVELTRTISANNWSTIMLPFDRTATQLQTDLGVTTVTLAAFDEYDSENKQLKFTSASSITANTPYMIKVSEAVTEAKTISGVTISASGDKHIDKNGVRFQGVYSSTKMDEGDYFVSGNKLYKATASTKEIKPFRAYFKDVPAGARLSFFDDEATGISSIDAEQHKTNNYYDLQGRRVAQPTKGMYIVNGKKVIIK